MATQDNDLYCSGCKVKFPNFAGLPWLFAEPQASWAEWRARWQYALQQLKLSLDRINETLRSTDLYAATRTRLEHRVIAETAHSKDIEALLAPLGLRTDLSGISTYLALRTRLPPDQGLLTYYNNVHRDWCWGDKENAASLALVNDALAEHKPKRMLVLGAGAGRLTYDLHQYHTPDMSIGFDFNPLLVGIAARVSTGERITMREFPIAPKTASDYGIERVLQAPEPANDQLHWMIGDIHRLPFATQQFDTIVTPWLIDIVPEELGSFASRINQLLTDDGCWINFGSLSFHNTHPAAQYSQEECAAIVDASGFLPPHIATRSIPYMDSPSSRHARTEEVIAWAAHKDAHIKRTTRYEALPDWLVRGQSPVPLTQGVRTQTTTTQVHAFLLSLIDGKRSLQDIAKIAAAKQLVPAHEAEATIRNFLIKMADEGRRLGY